MKLPNWQALILREGVVREPNPDPSRLILWISNKTEANLRHWQRISNVPGSKVNSRDGLCTTEAQSIRVREPNKGFITKLIQKIRRIPEAQTWTLPNGDPAEQCGERQTNLLFVWFEDTAHSLNLAQVQDRFFQGQPIHQLGENLFLASGPIAESKPVPPPTPSPELTPGKQAEVLLNEARRTGDKGREAAALTDMGIVLLRQGNIQRATPLFEEALTIARQLDDRTRESDVLDYLALAMLAGRQPERAHELLQHKLAYVRSIGDRFQEKLTLEHLGSVHIYLRHHTQAYEVFDQALALARVVNDRPHQADLLWYLAIECAEMGQRDLALDKGRKAITIFEELSNPQVGLLKENLQKFEVGSGNALSGQPGGNPFGGWNTVAVGSDSGGSGPGLLRLAITAVKSLTKFVGAGMQTLDPTKHQARLQICASCEHHTGVRCKLCGCFTSVKAWMPHETCPIGKWPVPESPDR